MKYLLCVVFFTINLFSFEEVVKKEISLKDIEKVWVENVNGSIEIYGEEIDKILIEATKKAEKKEYLKNLNVEISIIPNVKNPDENTKIKNSDELSKRKGKILYIKTEHTRSYFLGFLPVKMGGNVNYKIKVPKNLDLKIETVNGDVFVEEVDGLIECESVNGSLNFKEISGNGRFETVNGEIYIEIKEDKPKFSAESVNGDIFIKANNKINAYYSMEVVNGKIKIIPSIMEIKSSTPKEISGKWGDGEGKIDLETVNGNITIEIP